MGCEAGRSQRSNRLRAHTQSKSALRRTRTSRLQEEVSDFRRVLKAGRDAGRAVRGKIVCGCCCSGGDWRGRGHTSLRPPLVVHRSGRRETFSQPTQRPARVKQARGDDHGGGDRQGLKPQGAREKEHSRRNWHSGAVAAKKNIAISERYTSLTGAKLQLLMTREHISARQELVLAEETTADSLTP